MKDKHTLAVLCLAMLALPLLLACGQSSPGSYQVTHYARSGCPVCAEARTAVAGLSQEFPGRVVAEEVDATSPDATRAMRALEFRDHGLVIRGRRGEVLWKQSDHLGDLAEARETLRQLIQPSA